MRLTRPPCNGQERSTLLIVEDHDALRASLRGWMEVAFPQFLVLDVKSGEAAVALISADPPDLVLMDAQLPKMNGLEATRRIKARAPQAKVVIFALWDDADLRAAVSAAGASACILEDTLRSELIPTIEGLRSSLGGNGSPPKDTNSANGLHPEGDSRGTRE